MSSARLRELHVFMHTENIQRMLNVDTIYRKIDKPKASIHNYF